MSDPLRYILIGAGGWGAHWCKFFLPRLREMGKAVAVAAVDVSPDRFRHAQESLGLSPQHCFTDPLDAMEKRRADFVIICTPPGAHEQYLNMALTFDLHALCEMPLADTLESCLRIYRLARKSKRKVAAALGGRYDQDKQTLERLVRTNRFGRLNYLSMRFTHNCRKYGLWGKYRHEMPDPLLIEGASHHFDILRGLCDSGAKTVHAISWNPPWGEFHGDSSALVSMEMDSGVQCVYEGAMANASTLNGWGNEYIRAECEHGTIELDRRRLRVLAGGPMDPPREEAIPLLEQSAWGNAWVVEMFCDWLRGGPEPPTRFKDSVRSMATTFAAVESARTGRVVDVHEFLNRNIETASERKE